MSEPIPEWVRDPRLPQPTGYLEDAIMRQLICAEGEDAEREGLEETPVRAARAWRERTAGYAMDPADLFKTFEADGYDEMVVVRDVPFYSTCEQHTEDFIGHAHMAYVADGKIVGLSKLARLVDVFALRLQVQERLTMQIADAIDKYLAPKGVAVVVAGRHMCMERRGIRKPGCETVTSVVRGIMKDDPRARAEALSLMGMH